MTAMLLLGAAALAWGASWPAIKIVVSQMPIYSFRVLTAWGGGAMVLLIAWLMGNSLRLARRDIGRHSSPVCSTSRGGCTSRHSD